MLIFIFVDQLLNVFSLYCTYKYSCWCWCWII